MLFVEAQSPRGVFVICTGRTKLSTGSSDGKTLITQIADPGEVLGLSATVSGRPYEVTAETLDPCQINFVRRDDFLKFLSRHGEACLRVAEVLSNNYHHAYEQVRSLGLSQSTAEKLARLIVEWSDKRGRQTARGISVKLTLTHEEVGQLIGASRETVTRLLGDFKTQQISSIKGYLRRLLRPSESLIPKLTPCFPKGRGQRLEGFEHAGFRPVPWLLA